MRTAWLALLLLVGLAPRALGGEGGGLADGRGASGDGPAFLLANARLLDLPPVSKGSAIVSDAVLQDLPPVSSELKVVANPRVQDLPLVSEKSTVVADIGPQELPPVSKEPIVVADARPEELPLVPHEPIVVVDAEPQDLPAAFKEPIVVADAGPQELPPVPDGQFVAEAVGLEPPVAVVEPEVESDPLVWWSDQIRRPQLRRCASLPLSLDQLAIETLRHSHQVRALRMVPEIQETRIVQADAEFDADVFVESYWTDRDEPVGSFLTTGGPPRLLEDTLAENMGWRRKTRTGAEVEVSQQLVMQDSNSNFFIPENQAQSRLAIGLRQPLLRDGGKAYNRSLIVLAKIDTRTAWEGFAEGLQDHLLEVARQYWQLYYQRALVLQKERNLGRALAIREELESREQIDALRSQIARARAKVASRQAELVRARAGVKDAEARLRSLVNSPLLSGGTCLEVLPLDVPGVECPPIDLCEARQAAVENRPEIGKLLEQIRAAAVRTDMAKNQLLPQIALVLETYVNGLTGNYDLARSFGDQFSEGAPSYTTGLVIEVPLGRREAKARLRQRNLEMCRLCEQFSSATAKLAAEVEIAVREVNVAHAEYVSRLASVEATIQEVEYLTQRWRRLPGQDQTTSFVLEDLLDAEDRLVGDEQLLAAAQVRQALAYVEYRRALGTLLTQAPCYPVMQGETVVGEAVDPTPGDETPAE